MTYLFSRFKNATIPSNEPEVMYARMHRYWRTILVIACLVTITTWIAVALGYFAIVNNFGTGYARTASVATSTLMREQIQALADVFQARALNNTNLSSQMPPITPDPSQ